ncbi:MAG: cobyrinate a,c-diamide synthase [Thermodesulfobacteriota bacterium]
MPAPRIMIAALRGGAGKTVISTGISAALARRGLRVTAFKKGPDYIDAGWLTLASGIPCRNLDLYLSTPDQVRASFFSRTGPGDLAVIEANRGLFDGIDVSGATSSAELAKLLCCPVLLILDCTKTTRTLAALVLGCSHFDPEVDIRGVILNRVSGSRHEKNIRQNIERHAGIPVLGAVPKLPGEDFPERHLGLLPTHEHREAESSLNRAAEMAEKYLDLTAILSVARSPLQEIPPPLQPDSVPFQDGAAPVIGVARDAAFQFYYPENLEALVEAGARVLFFSLLSGPIPEMDGLYLGGGFPETNAEALSANLAAREKIRELALSGLPVYAECGGLMYLCRDLLYRDRTFPMAGVFPATVSVDKRPVGHGYTRARVDAENPFYAPGTLLLGHEFHYSRIVSWHGPPASMAFSMERGKGVESGRDGLVLGNTLATYTHIHATGTPQWAQALVSASRSRKASRRELAP